MVPLDVVDDGVDDVVDDGVSNGVDDVDEVDANVGNGLAIALRPILSNRDSCRRRSK